MLSHAREAASDAVGSQFETGSMHGVASDNQISQPSFYNQQAARRNIISQDDEGRMGVETHFGSAPPIFRSQAPSLNRNVAGRCWDLRRGSGGELYMTVPFYLFLT